jgi:hypothetical protein
MLSSSLAGRTYAANSEAECVKGVSPTVIRSRSGQEILLLWRRVGGGRGDYALERTFLFISFM